MNVSCVFGIREFGIIILLFKCLCTHGLSEALTFHLIKSDSMIVLGEILYDTFL